MATGFPFLKVCIPTGEFSVCCLNSSRGAIASVQAMAPQALNVESRRDPVVSESALKIILCGVLIYWGFIAFTFPVTNHDSQVYNLARLLVAEKAGFWQTSSWNANGQVMFPWTYDAVHYLFLKLGYGFALPSFAALLGILAIAYNVVSERYG